MRKMIFNTGFQFMFTFRRSVFTYLFLLFLCSGYAQAGPETGAIDRPSPDVERLRQHLYFLSSDELKGRETGSNQVDVASRYISSRFRSWGLKPVSTGSQDSYMQSVPLKKSAHRAKINVSGSSVTLDAPMFDRPYVTASEDGPERSLVFAGYGISDSERGYNDYANLTVKERYVVIFRHEPNESDPDSKFKGTSWSKGATFRQKYKTAKKHGAAGVLLINDPLGEHEGFPDAVTSSGWRLGKDSEESNTEQSIPFVALSPEQGAQLLDMSISELRALQKRIDRGPEPKSFELSDRKISISVSEEKIEYTTARNVVARQPGSGSVHNNEHIVIGAHYDHLGTRSDGEDRIYNGADDNASGTAAVLELARMFANHETPPGRTLIFVLFAAEEVGLFGSKYYARNPAVPLEDAVAMLNFDMVGRNEGTVSVYGAKKNMIFHRLNGVLDRRISDSSFKSQEIPDALSDHTSFAERNVPVLFYFTGFHDDYHGVNDEVDRIHFSGLRSVVQHGAMMIETLASQPVYPGEKGKNRKMK